MNAMITTFQLACLTTNSCDDKFTLPYVALPTPDGSVLATEMLEILAKASTT
jgi:hypothetical protein